jgi:hypothetical protein
MVNKRAFLVLMLTTTLVGSASAVSASDGSVTRRAKTSPVAIAQSPQESGPATALFVVGGRLLNVFRAVNGLGMVDLPTRGDIYQTNGIQDPPDGVDPLGVKSSRLPLDGPVPANSRVP